MIRWLRFAKPLMTLNLVMACEMGVAETIVYPPGFEFREGDNGMGTTVMPSP